LSILELARITPVAPPIRNILMNPNTQAPTVSKDCKFLPDKVISQVNTFIPVGTPMTIVAAVK
jgi:hypothetical protein